MIPLSFIEYANNRMMHQNTPFTITQQGEGFYILGEELIPMKRFNEMYPIDTVPSIKKTKGMNCDRSGGWLNGEKSY